MAKKKLEGKAKKQIDAALRRRHQQPALAAKHLREVLGYMSPDIVWQQVARTNPSAINELKAVLRTHHIGRPA